MSHWGFFEWLTYICVGIAAIIIAADQAIKGSAEMMAHFSGLLSSKVWNFAPFASMALSGVLLVGHQAGWIGVKQESAVMAPHSLTAPEDTTNNAALFLQFSDDQTVPREIRQTNILSWYALYTESIYVDTLNHEQKPIGGFSVPPRWTVFMLFKKPTIYRQMLAACVGHESLKCAVQFSNDRYAIITVIGSVTRATLDISVLP